MFCLVDDKGIIHVSKPDPGWVGGSANVSSFKVLHKSSYCLAVGPAVTYHG